MASISWFIPSLIKGSGGHRTILQHADNLQKKGHTCFLYLEDEHLFGDAAGKVKSLFGFDFNNVFYGWSKAINSDVAIATIWYSASYVAALPFECKKIYFVQDFEAWFNPMSDAYLMAENSYQYGLIPITIGRWLRHEIKQRFNVDGYHFEFGANLNIYKKSPSVKKEKAICFIYQPDKPRRCSKIGIEALGIVKNSLPDVKIYLYGSEGKGRVWFEHENLGLINLEQCNELYNRCRVGLCISSSNPSRIPFEMMAAGLPVVEIWRENNFYDFPSEAVMLAHQTPESLAAAMIKLLEDEELNDRMSDFGFKFMSGRDLSLETQQFSEAVDKVLNGQVIPVSELPKMYNINPVVATPKKSDILNAVQMTQPSFLRKLSGMLPSVLSKPLRRLYRLFLK